MVDGTKNLISNQLDRKFFFKQIRIFNIISNKKFIVSKVYFIIFLFFTFNYSSSNFNKIIYKYLEKLKIDIHQSTFYRFKSNVKEFLELIDNNTLKFSVILFNFLKMHSIPYSEKLFNVFDNFENNSYMLASLFNFNPSLIEIVDSLSDFCNNYYDLFSLSITAYFKILNITDGELIKEGKFINNKLIYHRIKLVSPFLQFDLN